MHENYSLLVMMPIVCIMYVFLAFDDDYIEKHLHEI